MRKTVLYSAPLKIEERYWFPYLNAVYSFGISDNNLKKEFELPTTEVYGYQGIGIVGNRIILSPCHTGAIAIYDIKQGNVKTVDVGGGDQCAFCHSVEVYKNKAIILPSVSESGIYVLDDEDEIHRIAVEQWGKDTKENVYIIKSAMIDRYLWITACNSNQVLKLDVLAETYELIQISESSRGYTGIAADGSNIWLADVSTGNLVKYNINSGELKEYKVPDNLECNLTKVCAVHNHLFVFGRFIISTPAMSGQMTLFDKTTEQYQIIENPFFEAAMKGNDLYPASTFAKKIDYKTLWVQRSLDGEIASINIEDLTYKTFSIILEEKNVKDMLETLYNCADLTYHERSEVSVKDLICYIKNSDGVAQRRSGTEKGIKIWKQLV